MIEFAPNPSGPAHLGTLRTYAKSWLLARKLDSKLFVRFDAHSKGSISNKTPLQISWAHKFLNEIETLGIEPDAWQYLEDSLRTSTLPSGTVLERSPNFNLDLAMHHPVPIPKMVAARLLTDWIPPKESIPMVLYPERPYMAIRRMDSNDDWDYAPVVTSAIHMALRGTTITVRAWQLQYVREFHENPLRNILGLRLPEVDYAALVVTESGPLRKSSLEPSAPYTVEWAIKRFGAKCVREAIIESAKAEPINGIVMADDILRQ